MQQTIVISRCAMACTFAVVLPGAVPCAVEAGGAALDEIERLEQKLSIYREDSDISGINREARLRPVAADAEVFDLLAMAARLAAETGGAFDAASGAIVKAWGFNAGPKRVPPEVERVAALAASGMRHVALDAAAHTVAMSCAGVELNLGAIGKGYAIDRAVALLRREFNISSALVHGGQSSVRAMGAPPGEPEGWKVAIGDPCRPRRTVATVRLRDRALGTSGSAHQFFEAHGRRYGHVLDPRSARPADELFSATAIAPTAAEADALSTAFFVMGMDATRAYVQAHRGIAAVLVGRGRVVALGLAKGDVDLEARSI